MIITTSSRAALPARSPMPLIVHSTWRAPCLTAVIEFAVARPRSLWQWTAMIALSTLGTRFMMSSMIEAKISGVV